MTGAVAAAPAAPRADRREALFLFGAEGCTARKAAAGSGIRR